MLKIFIIFLSLFSLHSYSDFSFKRNIQNENLSLKSLRNFVFSKELKHSSNALLIIVNDKIIVEDYKNGFHKEMPHRIWSISKSFTGALYGIAIKKGLLSIDEAVQSYYQLESKNPYAKLMTLKHLLRMSSGFDWSEGYENNPLDSNVINMLFISNYRDMATYASKRSIKHKPGSRFNYSSGETNLLMGILQKKLKENYQDFPWKELFEPLNMKNITWEKDHTDNYVGSSYLYMTARDLAKFGRLYLKDGVWEGKQILPKGYVEETTTVAPSFLKTKLKGEDNSQSYGLHWWLNKDLIKEKNEGRPYPRLSENALFGLGHHGQTLIVMPKYNAIAVRYGSDKDASFNRKIFTDKLAAFLNSVREK
ncbi:serine hydrolase [Bacteriovoracaceae bacterium]|nr:serine hydrolase [Bacteriovoracaceae bacterium]